MKATRRQFTAALGLAAALYTARPIMGWAVEEDALRRAIMNAEEKVKGRFGVFIVDTDSEKFWMYRGAERFPMCSTFKVLICATVLWRVDREKDYLDRVITYSKEQLVKYSPVTEKHVENGMTLAQLCEAAMTLSDNTAANLILETIGGPPGLTSFLRFLGDDVTRLDRFEPDLNEAIPGDERDTTTPNAMATTLRFLTTGKALTVLSRNQLAAWMIANKTGDRRLRAGLPGDWIAGDKTGSGAHGTTNDIAVIWPPGRGPVVVAAYLTQSEAVPEERDAAHAAVGAAITAHFSQ